jgi:hypothetical protein
MYVEVVLPSVQLYKSDLNTNYANPTSDDLSKTFRPDDFKYQLANLHKIDAFALFYTFKIIFDDSVKYYRKLITYIEEGIDLNIEKTINNIYPSDSKQYELVNDSFINITISSQLFTKLLNYYEYTLHAIPQYTQNTNNNDVYIKYDISYDDLFNITLEEFYKGNINNLNIPLVNLNEINLKSIITNFFDNISPDLTDDNERQTTLLKILHDWYLKCKNIYVFLETQYLKSIASLADISSEYVKFAWIEKIGHYIIEEIEILIGGKRIDKHYSDWLNIWNELSKNIYHKEEYDKMIGNVQILTNYDNLEKPEYKLYIPLQFWFCRNNGLALPLVALRYHDIQFNIKFRKLEECLYIEDGYSITNKLHIVSASLYVDYIYLDSDERTRFARASHEYLIEQLQINEFKNIITPTVSCSLDFSHPCKEIIWTCQANRYLKNPTNSNYILKLNNYSYSSINKGNPIKFAKIEFNTHSRIQKIDGDYFNYVQPYQHYSNTPPDGINVYSFALQPELHQPSGTVNFSRINFCTLQLTLDPQIFYNENDIDNININTNTINHITEELANMMPGIIIKVYCVNYNVLRIMSGMGGLAFVV